MGNSLTDGGDVVKHWWHSGSEEIPIRRLQDRLMALPDHWMISPTEYGFYARAPEESPDKPLILDAKDLSTIESWATASHHQRQEI